jgi:hypothetical protein
MCLHQPAAAALAADDVQAIDMQVPWQALKRSDGHASSLASLAAYLLGLQTAARFARNQVMQLLPSCLLSWPCL